MSEYIKTGEKAGIHTSIGGNDGSGVGSFVSQNFASWWDFLFQIVKKVLFVF
jgi:hypothetical protein